MLACHGHPLNENTLSGVPGHKEVPGAGIRGGGEVLGVIIPFGRASHRKKRDGQCAAVPVHPVHLEAGESVGIRASRSNRYPVCTAGFYRHALVHVPLLVDEDRFEFAWIVDFPMFEWNEDEKKVDFSHNPFSMPQGGLEALQDKDPLHIKAFQYDIACNGFELASGSIRIHDPTLQKRIFKIVGFDEEEGMKKFGFLTEAFKYGAPPHGGIAPGLDRLVMLMAGETSIKEVIAFPKNSFAVNPMDDCPNEVDQKQLDELHLIVKYPEEKK